MDDNGGSRDHLSSDHRYLESLEFDPALRKSWLNFFVSNFRVIFLLIVLVSAWGLYAFFTLPRESNPEVKIPIAVVTTVYPGASPSDVEELVTKKLETAVAGLKGLDKVTSNSANSLSAITVEFDPKEDLEGSIRSLRDKVSAVRFTLPSEAREPQVTEISLDDQPIYTAVVTGPYDGFAMRNYGEDIQADIEKVPGVRTVHISGGDIREFEVAYDPQKLIFYGVSADQANQAIAATNLAIPGGNFEGQKFVYPIRSDSRLRTVQDLGGIAVGRSAAGGVILLRDVAAVAEKAIERTVYSRISIGGSEPKDSMTLSVVKRTGSSILDTVDQAERAIDARIAALPPGIRYETTLDMAKFVRDDFDQLTHDFLLTLILVFGILFLIVGLKEAFVAGLAIPLVFFVTFGVLQLLGISLNFLSVFSLILALGLLVDDAIVVVSATKQYLNTGKFTPEEAVLLVLNDFKVVLTTTTLTTVWAFLPLLFSSGIMGEYIKSIPVTVSITLLASLAIALMINHPLAAVLERIRLTRRTFFGLELLLALTAAAFFYAGGWLGYALGVITLLAEIWMIVWYERGGRARLEGNAALVEAEWADERLIKRKLKEQGNREESSFLGRLVHGIIHFNRILPLYEAYLQRVIATRRRRIATLAVTGALFVFALALPAVGIVQSEFFPPSDQGYIYVEVRTPVGTRIEETDKAVQSVEQKLLAYPEIGNFSTIVGRPGPETQSFQDSSNLASITISLKDKSERDSASYALADRMREDIGAVEGAKVTVKTPSSGPPSGAAFEARIKGDDLGTLNRIARDLEPRLASIAGVINTDVSLKDSAPEYTFVLDSVKLQQNGLNAAYVGSMLRMAISGTEVSTVLEEGKETKIIARFAKDKIPSLDSVQNLQILNMMKQPVFLKDVSRIELRPAVDSITRIDQKRTVLLSAGADSTTNSTAVLQQFQEKTKDYQLPADYSITYGGENEQNNDSVLSILRAMLIAMVLIVATLVVQFNSVRKAVIVLVTIPLALIGVFIGMALFDVKLSFPGLIGILALFGIVVKNAIILVDKMNLNIKSGIPFMEAVRDAGKSRLEAIFITSICTILGILPVTLSNELWRSLGGAVIFGLTLSSFLTLFIVPTLFITLIGEKERF